MWGKSDKIKFLKIFNYEWIKDNQNFMWKVAYGVTKGTKEWEMEQAIRGISNII